MIELSRNINFGQYINNGSLLTRLDPRVKLLSEVLLIVLVSYISSFTAFALFFLCCIVIQWTSRISVGYTLRGFKNIVIFLIVIYIIEVLFYPSSSHQLWQWGIFNISWDGIVANIKIMLRVVFLYYLASLLLFTTSLLDLTDGSE
ncbi:MAG: energy-coupling factor transporter transmembrane protein EcfT, partial [Chloroflexota bacterium]|nr:energy-coupling factor transporter transmembrane protein EcfT [Chloroflexota bacterium]